MNFDEEHHKTTEKMADLVMEYVSRFIAQDHLDAYERARDDAREEFVPTAFDDKIYKKTARQIKGKKGDLFRLFRICVGAAVLVLLAFYFASMV